MANISGVRRFDQSFVFHMIRDFFLALIVVVAAELGIRFAVMLYEFEHHDKTETKQISENLASDLKSIMLNSGGPVAARTVYPILKRNHKDLGAEIAIVPDEVTITSMKTMFNLTPQGIPPKWPEGKHHEFTVKLTAEKFCLTCHIDAKIGEVLGYVTVRKYLSTKIDIWWHEVRLTSMMALLNIFIHTIVLLLLLKIRMDPLVNLHSTVSTLAKGIINLSYRATVKTHDEFGELALDLNHFLDRLASIIDDLRHIVDKVIEVNQQVPPIRKQIREQLETIHEHNQRTIKYSFEGRKAHPVFSQENFEVIEMVLTTLEQLRQDGKISEESGSQASRVLDHFKTTVQQAQDTFQHFDQLGEMLVEMSGEVHGLALIMGEMAVLEEKMQAVSEAGHSLLHRLSDAEK